MTKRSIGLWIALVALACLPQPGFGMVFRPEKGAMWDPSIIWRDGKYYAFFMYNQEGRDGLKAGHCLLATSTDGVHWEDQGVIIDERGRSDGATFFKCFVSKCGDKFVMNHGVLRKQGQDLMRFYQSKDLRTWEYITSMEPDERWYTRSRWDHMYMLPKEEGKPEAGYWGYIVAVAKEKNHLPAMMESKDGLTWEALPPCTVEWGNTPPIGNLEYGGCERIGGKYYLIGGSGWNNYMGNRGYAMFTFVADNPRGPFRPVGETFRLSGNSEKYVGWLAAWSRAKDELLISNYASMPVDGRAPWLLPLRKPVLDQKGQLRLGWWKGNEALKGEPMPLGKRVLTLNGEGKPGGYDVVYLDEKFVPSQGLVLEGRLKVKASVQIHPVPAKAVAGFVIEEKGGTAMAVQLGIGKPEDRETHIGRLTTDPDGTRTFASEDVTGKGCATVTGVEDGKEHNFRLLCRMEMFELYIDDLLMQTYTHRPGSGRVGFLVLNGQAEFSDLKAWAMSFPVPKTDKTLVAWVAPANLAQQGGSSLTIQSQSGDQFDAIVFGEQARGKWMAGSDNFRRTQRDQNANAAETAGPDALVQVAIVYEGDNVRLYRNGAAYAAYTAQNIDLLNVANHIAVFGLRHVGAGSGRFAGMIEDARIYGRALTAAEIQSLKPNIASDIKPLAWWDFEGDAVKDRAGHFTHHALVGGAKLKGGRLVLDGTGSLFAARSEADAKQVTGSAPAGPYVPETPVWPDQPPANWMTFHLAHPGPGVAMPGDPNCIFDYKGKVHLHYIYRNAWGYVFGHVSSDDMVRWTWHKTVLAPPTTGHGMFSGTGFYTKEGRPAIIYHGQGSGRNQIAVAEEDSLDQWSKPWKLEPKIRPDQDASKIANWDPDIWLNGDTYYALSGGTPGSGKPPTLFKSSDLMSWDYLGLFLSHDMPDVLKTEDVSCPNFFKIGNKHMLLCISHNLGCRYYLGDWKDEKFTPDFHARMSWNGNNFFAPESVLTHDGRRVMWAWLRMPIAPTGVQSLPRELELPADGVLRIRPLRELQSLRADAKQETAVTLKSGVPYRLKDVRGDAMEVELTFQSPTARELGLDVLCDQNGENGLRVAVVPETRTLNVGAARAPFALKPGEDLTLRVFIDKNLVEVFANDRQAAVAAAATFVPESLNVRLFSNGGDAMVKSAKGWKMQSIYPPAVEPSIKVHGDH